MISIHIDGNQSYKEANEKKELESVLRKKEDTLRKLKLVKMYRAKVIVRPLSQYTQVYTTFTPE